MLLLYQFIMLFVNIWKLFLKKQPLDRLYDIINMIL